MNKNFISPVQDPVRKIVATFYMNFECLDSFVPG
jgi:hypothetical protein